ncbi:lactonase family protein [Variovorax sp. J22G21]|uniref:lactonase family protein n=1 Tax=Variovorax fucosicus TaxID=3053517 RepID=UPI002578E8F1|nr:MULTISPECIES: lactonase family protein [unclassified Variovorax]MDM0040166.1 lactonase family protein [Variovorax sp. J22R193]MDM0061539.1 lactonase family protein [Variovorax sp. J22G21]
METYAHPTIDRGALRAYVGCRTTRERDARGRGIAVFDVDGQGVWTHWATVATDPNPSYLLFDGGERHLHCVHGDGSTVSTFRCDEAGGLALSGSVSTEGRNPVHLVLSPNGHWCLIANYASGDIVALPVRNDGSLDAVAHCLALPDRRGPHRTQQQGAHPHQVVFDPSGKWLLVPDKGSDAVHTIAFDPDTGALRLACSLRTAPGSGPRHLAFDATGNFAWVVLELSSQLLAMAFDADTGTLTPAQRVPTVPEFFTGENTGAGIALSHDGAAVFVSNRGHGSVVRFQITPADGTLHSPEWVDTRGAVPRFITLVPDAPVVLVANEDADTIVALDESPLYVHDQALAYTGSPVCITFTKGTP